MNADGSGLANLTNDEGRDHTHHGVPLCHQRLSKLIHGAVSRRLSASSSDDVISRSRKRIERDELTWDATRTSESLAPTGR